MSLRTRTILLVFFLVALASLSLSLASRYYLYPKFIQLEDEQAIRNANIGLELLNNEVGVIADRPADWGYWDDTYQYVMDRNEDYASSNLSIDTQYSLNINLFAIYDTEGNKVWSQAMDLVSQKSYPLDEYEAPKLPLHHPFLSHENTPFTRAGLMNSSRGPIFLASTPILHSDRTGPTRGTIIFGRMLEAEKIRRIATQPGLELKLSPYKKTANDIALTATDNGVGRLQHTPLKITRYENLTEVTTTLFSIDGKPSIDMSVSMPPDISKRGLKILDGITMSIFIGGLLLSVLLTYVLNRSVTRPITRITQHLVNIGDQENLGGRIGLERTDEIGELANAFDEMLQRLSDTRKRLFKQSYETGASEMASGVIQDINKSIQPIRDNIELPLGLLDKAHTSTSASLIHELADTKIGSHRFIEVTQQLMDLNNEQSLVLAEARSEMRRLRIDIEHLQEVVSDYSKFISQDTENGSVNVANLIGAASKKLPPEDRQLLNIDIDSGVYHAAPVAASQNLLQQVVNVLISHFMGAAEKVDAHPMNLRITCRTELSHGSVQLHFCFDDNRPRMTSAEFRNYLSENWSQEHQTDASLGLPWAESAITSMRGKLFVELSQLMTGITIHLVLPRAKLDEN